MSDPAPSHRDKLAARAEQAGVATSYWTVDSELREAPTETLEVVLDAMAEKDRRKSDATDQILDPARVTRRTRLPAVLEARLGDAGAVEVRWALELETEDGGSMRDYGTALLDEGGTVRIPCTWVPAVGYHRLILVAETGNRRWTGEQLWVVAPDGCWPATEGLAGDRGAGVLAQLYSLRSDHNWGFGDLGDIIELARRSAVAGADFVALSPLHSLVLHGGEASPYAPSSRLFRNPLVIDIEAVPELAACEETRAWLATDSIRHRLDSLRAADEVDYGAVTSLKMQALRRLHRRFRHDNIGKDTERSHAYAVFRREQGPLLDAFATFQTLSDLFFEAEGNVDWRDWPNAFRSAQGAEVRAFAAEHAELVDFHRFLQFEVDRQLALADATARASGLRLGLIHDLAFGCYAGGFDTWVFPELFAGGVELGCPPDRIGPLGQVWGLPPVVPSRLEEDGYRYWTRIVRCALAHGGGLRVDHALGLVRQFWVPHGSVGAEGTYVAAPQEALLGILALESRRARSLVIGEDLGTAPPDMDTLLAERHILSTRLLPFVRDDAGGFPPPTAHEPRALLLATTHDLPTLAAWWRAEDLDLRRRLGLLSDRDWTDGRTERRADREALLDRLNREGIVPRGPAVTQSIFLRGVHAYLARTSAQLVGIWLDDATNERRPANIPGAAPDVFRPWRRRLRASIQAIFKDPAAAAAIHAALDRDS